MLLSLCMFCVKFPSPAAADHHSLEQREATTQSKQMASHARPPHRDRRQEEGEVQRHSQLTLRPALTSEWQHDKLSVAQFVYACLSLSRRICYSVSLVLLLDVYFSLSPLPIHVYLTCPLIRVAFTFINVTHSHHFFSVSLSLSFSPPRAKSIVIHSSQSLNMIYCNMIISHSFSQSLKAHARQHIAYSTRTKIHYCISRRPPVGSYLTLP